MSSEAPNAAAASSSRLERLRSALEAALPGQFTVLSSPTGELTCEVPAAQLLTAARTLRDGEGLKFEMCMDVCGVDYLEHGRAEWKTQRATLSGFSRGRASLSGAAAEPGRRFAVVYHLLSVSLNQRLRLRSFCEDDELPAVDSVSGIWSSADWFEREAFDLFGILFKGHPDLRRLLTDYGFIGHPFRKDFPLSGNVEVRYDPEKGRVVYQPVSIEPRTLVPKVIRHDNRYDPQLTNAPVAPLPTDASGAKRHG
jgi:NADH-quinone oxidoreductase subunit C